MIYAPNGKVVRVEPISGPRLLSSSLAQQMMDWIVRTDASGDELCQTLVIAKFTMRDSGQAATEEPRQVAEPSILRLFAETAPLPLDVEIEDPAPLRGFGMFRSEVNWRVKRIVHKIFGPR
jgi:MoxR-like ATPase